MVIFVLEADPKKLNEYGQFLEDYLSKRNLRVGRISFGETSVTRVDFLIVEGSFLSHRKRGLVRVSRDLLFGDYFLLFGSSKVQAGALKKVGIKLYEIKDRHYALSLIRVIETVLHDGTKES